VFKDLPKAWSRSPPIFDSEFILALGLFQSFVLFVHLIDDSHP
jgi:hypothetical protein